MPPHIQAILDTSRVSEDSILAVYTTTKPQIPQVRVQSYSGARPIPQHPSPCFRCRLKVQVVLSDLLAVNQRSHDLTLGLMNLLEKLTGLRKTVYLLDYQFIIKIYNLVRKSEVVKWSHYSQSAKFLKHEEMILLLL